MKKFFGVLAATTAAIVPATAGQLIHGLTTDHRLVAFDRSNPGVVVNSVPITGLAAADALLGIDFRPATGELWGTSASRLYTIDPTTGVATDRTGGTPFTITGASIGFDFNPLVDRIRVVGIDDQDLRLNPLTGGLAFIDGNLAYNDGSDMRAVASAYANNFAGTLATTLYNIDAGAEGWRLTIQTPPNSGANVLVGDITGLDDALKADELRVGFDIAGTSSFGYLSIGGFPMDEVSSRVNGLNGVAGLSQLYRLDLATGVAQYQGWIGDGLEIRDIAMPVPESQTLAPVLAGLGVVIASHWRRRRNPATA